MLYKRQKIMLALLDAFGGRLNNTEMQKYLFLLSTLQAEKSYHFVPYKYGCFSFQAYQDKRVLIEKGYLVGGEECVLAKRDNFIQTLSFQDVEAIRHTQRQFARLKGDQLIAYVYRTYPYYAIYSEILDKILEPAEVQSIQSLKPHNQGSALFSIGYEGKSLEEFLNILIKANIKILCDVRKNPISRKYGFSKKTLMNALSKLGIAYRHFPSLGIDSDKRKHLASQTDYDALFVEYENTVLKNNASDVAVLRNFTNHDGRIAVLCYEQLPAQCHRTRVAKAVLAAGTSSVDFLEV